MIREVRFQIEVPGLTGIGKAAAALVEAIRPLQEQIAQIGRRWELAYPRMLKDASQLGKMGWTVPMWGDPRFAAHLVHEVGASGVDSYFLDHYKGPRANESKKMLTRVGSADLLHPWHEVLEQAASAHRSRLHLVVVPTLLPVLEGALAAAAGQFRKGPNARRQSKLLADVNHGRVSGIVLVSLHSFVTDLFESWKFESDPPERLNRHWILHGRSPAKWTTADALRLWHALDSLAGVTEPALSKAS